MKRKIKLGISSRLVIYRNCKSKWQARSTSAKYFYRGFLRFLQDILSHRATGEACILRPRPVRGHRGRLSDRSVAVPANRKGSGGTG